MRISKKQLTTHPEKWQGTVELRGLPAKTFHVTDYVNDKDLGTVTGPNRHPSPSKLMAAFSWRRRRFHSS